MSHSVGPSPQMSPSSFPCTDALVSFPPSPSWAYGFSSHAVTSNVPFAIFGMLYLLRRDDAARAVPSAPRERRDAVERLPDGRGRLIQAAARSVVVDIA